MGKFAVFKGQDGSSHLLGKFSNRWRDWDFHADPEHGGEIIGSGSHKEYADWLDKNPHHAPELWTWHVWGTARKNRADWWAWSGNFFYADWELTEDEAEAIEKWAGTETLGMSFGFYVLKYDHKDAVIERYRAFEASILPVGNAANHWTSITIVPPPAEESEKSRSEVMAIPKKKLEALVALHGQEFADALVSADEKVAEILDSAGIESKEEAVAEAELGEADAEAVAATEEPEVPAASQQEVLDALKRMESVLGGDILALSNRLADLEKRLSTAEKEREVEAKAMAAPASILAAWTPRSILETPEAEAKAITVDGRSKLARSAPAAPAAPKSYISALLDL